MAKKDTKALGKRKRDEKATKNKRQKREQYWKEWKQIYLAGTELENLDKAYDYDWDFSHLEKDIKSGDLRGESKFVYIFGATEPQLLKVDDGSEEEKEEITYIPVFTCIVGDVAPPEKMGIMSIMKKKEEIIDFKDMKFSWSPFIREEANKPKNGKKQRFTPLKIFHLNCKLRKSSLKQVKEKRKITYQYLLPYISKPKELLKEDDDTFVQGFFRKESGEMVNFDMDFNWDNKEKIRYLKQLMIDYQVDPKAKNDLKNTIKKALQEGKEAYEKKKADKLALFNSIPKERREGLDNLKFYKYYPKKNISTPEVEKFQTSFINRYFGKATKVYPEIEEETTNVWGN